MFVDRASNRMLRVRLCRDGMYSKSDILGMSVWLEILTAT